MTLIKSFSVGNGDMFYIRHNSDNFTIIDCCLDESTQDSILKELASKSSGKGISRFISTHPDDDHLRGLEILNKKLPIVNFYCVKNEATKEDETPAFSLYRSLRDSDKAYYLVAGCKRKWMNESDEERGAAGISIQWPKVDNEKFQTALSAAKNGESPNNISPIIRYHLENGMSALWMGDLETEFMESAAEQFTLNQTDIIFAPHHGRDSGKIPEKLLQVLNPRLIVIGEAPAKHLNYYSGYNTITQNSAGDITFDLVDDKAHVYVSSESYKVDFLKNLNAANSSLGRYIGSLA